MVSTTVEPPQHPRQGDTHSFLRVVYYFNVYNIVSYLTHGLYPHASGFLYLQNPYPWKTHTHRHGYVGNGTGRGREYHGYKKPAGKCHGLLRGTGTGCQVCTLQKPVPVPRVDGFWLEFKLRSKQHQHKVDVIHLQQTSPDMTTWWHPVPNIEGMAQKSSRSQFLRLKERKS